MHIDWTTVASLGTAAGTLVLAFATFAAVRSANQAARTAEHSQYDEACKTVTSRGQMTVDLLYGDHEGGQRVITRFGLMPRDDENWLLTAGRYWNVDRPDPRDRPRDLP